MNYVMWKDLYFYIYLLFFVGSLIVFVNSIKDYIEAEKEDLKLIEDEVIPQEDDEEKENFDEIVISHKDDEVVIKKENNNENIERIEFNDSPLFSSSSNENKVQDNKETSQAVEFLININSSLERILSELDFNKKKISDVENKLIETESSKIYDITKRVESIEVKLEEISKKIDYSLSSNIPSNIKITPKYIFKYLSDIVDDFDNLEKENIKKRIMFIISEVKKEIEEEN